jgi:hypothetical protein
MNGSDAVAGTDHEEESGTREWNRLRTLLLADERASLNDLNSKLGNAESITQTVAGVLPEAATLRASKDNSVSKAFAPVIEDSLHHLVRENPQPLADALYPIMGPAIRRSIRQALEGMLANLNTALEHAFSPKSLKWRFDAWRSGETYARVVLLNTLAYQVEQVFLIHRESSLLLGHAWSDRAVVNDPDMV